MEIRKMVKAMNNIVDITEDQQDMMVKLIEMKDGASKDFEMKRVSSEIEWELLRRD